MTTASLSGKKIIVETKKVLSFKRMFLDFNCSVQMPKKLAGTVDKIPILILKQYKKITHIYLIHLFIYLISYYEVKKSDKDNTPTI